MNEPILILGQKLCVLVIVRHLICFLEYLTAWKMRINFFVPPLTLLLRRVLSIKKGFHLTSFSFLLVLFLFSS